jgi:hypothetical protein
MGRLCTRGEYLRTKRNAHELFWDISAFLPGESKSLRKELMDPSPPTETVKEKGRGEGKFRASGAGSCPSPSDNISSTSNSKMFCASRSPAVRSLANIIRCCFSRRNFRACASKIWAESSRSNLWRRDMFSAENDNLQDRLWRTHCS